MHLISRRQLKWDAYVPLTAAVSLLAGFLFFENPFWHAFIPMASTWLAIVFVTNGQPRPPRFTIQFREPKDESFN